MHKVLLLCTLAMMVSNYGHAANSNNGGCAGRWVTYWGVPPWHDPGEFEAQIYSLCLEGDSLSNSAFHCREASKEQLQGEDPEHYWLCDGAIVRAKSVEPDGHPI
jgi:hypothetical protein